MEQAWREHSWCAFRYYAIIILTIDVICVVIVIIIFIIIIIIIIIVIIIIIIIICVFPVDDGLLDVNEIDPIGRHLSHSAKNRYGHSSYRYSSFKVCFRAMFDIKNVVKPDLSNRTMLKKISMVIAMKMCVQLRVWVKLLLKQFSNFGKHDKLNIRKIVYFFWCIQKKKKFRVFFFWLLSFF